MNTEKLARIDELKKKISSFDRSSFGHAEPMPGGVWKKPPFTPERGKHPRLMINGTMITSLKNVLLGDSPEYQALRESFWRDANTETDGVFPETTVTETSGTRSVTHPFAYDEKILAAIEAKALAYAVTGDEEYGYAAVLCMKNAILSLRYMYEGYEGMGGAVWTGGSHTMNVVSEVYDWCYDLLTDSDKDEIIAGMRTNVLSQIEFKYPPSNMGCVSGHGTGTQMFVEYMNVAAAFADERPDWWDYVAGRFYQEYIPVAEYMYSAGFVSQGTSYYAQNKYYGHIWAALMLTTLGDENPFGEGMYTSPYKFLSHLMPNGNYFQTGDANWMKGQKAQGAEVLYNWVFVAAALTKDPVILSIAARSSEGCSKYNYALAGGRMTPTVMAFCIANCLSVKSEEKPLDLVDYTAYPGGQTVLRSSWDEDAVAVLMRVGDLTMANHDHEDSGTFQIYYKGLLACESGFYTGVDYGKPHWRYYHHASVSHNCPLIYDPLSKHLQGENAKYYTGGQRLHREAKSLEEWLGGDYHVGRILGHGEGDGYAYIGGDITGGYDKDEVECVKRDMLAVLGKEAPLMFLVYDDVTSVNPQAIKKFLLHTVKEPEIKDGVITVKQDGGKLTVVPLFGADKTEKIGGDGKEFWVGKNGDDGYNVSEGVWDEYFGSLWGRVELSSEGKKNNRMLVFMCADDAESDRRVVPELIENETAVGCVALDNVMLFAKSEGKIEVTTDFEGEKRYVVAGLPYGDYRVTLGEISFDLSVKTDRASSSGHEPLEADKLYGLEELRSNEISGSISFTLGSGRITVEKL